MKNKSVETLTSNTQKGRSIVLTIMNIFINSNLIPVKVCFLKRLLFGGRWTKFVIYSICVFVFSIDKYEMALT